MDFGGPNADDHEMYIVGGLGRLFGGLDSKDDNM